MQLLPPHPPWISTSTVFSRIHPAVKFFLIFSGCEILMQVFPSADWSLGPCSGSSSEYSGSCGLAQRTSSEVLREFLTNAAVITFGGGAFGTFPSLLMLLCIKFPGKLYIPIPHYLISLPQYNLLLALIELQTNYTVLIIACMY